MLSRNPTAHTASRFHPARLIVTWFGAGYSPVASGTAGSLAALPFAALIQHAYGAFGLFAFAITVFLGGWFASWHYFGFCSLENKADPKEIVVDEVAGQCLLLAMLPLTWQAYLLGFLLFRAFDIVKPWPVSWADQKVGGALGVMLDDMLAALYPMLLVLGLFVAASMTNHENELFHLLGIFGW